MTTTIDPTMLHFYTAIDDSAGALLIITSYVSTPGAIPGWIRIVAVSVCILLPLGWWWWRWWSPGGLRLWSAVVVL